MPKMPTGARKPAAPGRLTPETSAANGAEGPGMAVTGEPAAIASRTSL